MQPFHCTAPAYSRPQSEVTAAPSSLPLAFRPPTASRNDARLAAIAHWSAQWHNGHLFLRDPMLSTFSLSFFLPCSFSTYVLAPLLAHPLFPAPNYLDLDPDLDLA